MADATDLDKKYVYKISRSGVFLGLLPNVTSEFVLAQDINSAGATVQITVADTPDRQFEAPSILTTEEGAWITDENGVALTEERQPDLVGNSNSRALIRNNNTIQIYEFSKDYPNGKLVFSGWISRWKGSFGGQDVINITCLSNGSELDNYLVSDTLTVDQSQALIDNTYLLFSFGKGNELNAGALQGFVVGAGITRLNAVEFSIAAGSSAYVGTLLQLDIYANQSDAENGVNSLATVQQAIQSTAATVQTFRLPVSIAVTALSTYYAVLTSLDGIDTQFYLGYQSTAPYTGAIAETYDSSPGGGSRGWQALAGDFYFKTYYAAGATSVPYTSTDPTSILRSIIDGYVSRGGTINYASGTTTLTGLSRSYTFKVNTILEGIKKCLELAPYDWYWYVDPATNVLYFKETNTVADITFVYGRHLQSIDIEATVEDVKTQAYFTGGDTGGNVYLYTSQSNATALAANAGRVGLARLVDNRVTTSNTATALVDNFLNSNNAETYNTVAVINADVFDTYTIAPGLVAGFKGFGNFVDNLLLQVARIERHPDYVILGLGALPKRASAVVEDILRDLNDVQTIYNPTTPS